jgi:hypothetical protein
METRALRRESITGNHGEHRTEMAKYQGRSKLLRKIDQLESKSRLFYYLITNLSDWFKPQEED